MADKTVAADPTPVNQLRADTVHRREISKLRAQGDVIDTLLGLFMQTSDLLNHPNIVLLVGQDAPPMPASAWVVSDHGRV